MAYLISVLIGLAFGSFANVCIVRLPEDQSLFFPRSRCPRCQKSLKPHHNIPVISFLFLKGRCAFCRLPISKQYPLVEASMALLFVFHAWWFTGSVSHMAVADILCFYLLTLSIIDYHHRIIPDELSLSLLAIGLLFSFANPYFDGTPWMRVAHSVSAAIAGGLLMLFTAWAGEKAFKKEAMGGGDIKLIAATGAVLGWAGILGPLLIGSMTGGIVALVLLALKKKKLGETLPFGPFLSLGAYLICLFPGIYSALFVFK